MRKVEGFTLIEVLVVLTLLSIISTTLFQGLSSTLKLRSRVYETMLRQNEELLLRSWLDSLLSTMMAVPESREQIFQGTNEKIYGVSANTISGPPGVPGEFNLHFTISGEQLSILYDDQFGSSLTLKRWEGGVGTFTYMNEGETYPTWPPAAMGNEPNQLPQAIFINVDGAKDEIELIFSIAGLKEPRLRGYDLF